MALFAVLALCLSASVASAGEAVPMAQNPKVEARLMAISEELRCLVCQNETLAASRAELADDLRKEVRRLIIEGKSDAEIKDYLVARYGDFVLYRPPVKPKTWLLWFGPLLILAISIVALLAYLRKRKASLDDDAEVAMSEADHAEAQMLLGEREGKA
ncbi:MAG: cytochrome c-type biogenesis protein [Georgfuchsia sp.]